MAVFVGWACLNNGNCSCHYSAVDNRTSEFRRTGGFTLGGTLTAAALLAALVAFGAPVITRDLRGRVRRAEDALRRVVSSACREFDAGGVLDSPAPAGLPEAPLRYPEAPAVWRVYPCPEYWIPLESPPRWRAPAFIRRPIPYFRRRPRGGVQEPTRRRTSGLRAHTPRLPDRWPG